MQKFKKKRIKRYKNLNIIDKIVIIIIQYDGPHRKIQENLQIIRSNKRLREFTRVAGSRVAGSTYKNSTPITSNHHFLMKFLKEPIHRKKETNPFTV